MSTRRAFLLIALMFFLILPITGCHFANVQEYKKENLCFSGANYLGWGNFHYGFISIGTEKDPFFKSPPQFTIKLPNGELLRSTELTIDDIKNIYGIKNTTRNDTITYFLQLNKNPTNATVYFQFKGSNLINFKCMCYDFVDPDEINLQIGTIDGSKFYKIPLREWQLEELFGKADNIKTKWVY
jgi:hypothetical protein